VELAKRKFLNFVTYTKKDYEVNWHHELLASYLDRFSSGDIKKLMVFMPPQHGKSELTSRRLPAYLLGKNPKLKVVGCSYSSDLAKSFNRDVQRIIDEQDYKDVFPQTKLNESNVKTVSGSYLRNADIFETIEHRGFYKSVGVGGSLTGTSVDIAIIDDPVKDAIEGNSLTDQARKWEWYTNVLLTRLHNDSQQLITMTRWHKEDLCGKILQRMPEGWEVLRLEAIKQNETHEADVREYGEALWEAKHSKKKIMSIAKANPNTFNALYQGDPKPSKTMQYCSTFSYPKHVKKIEYIEGSPLHYTVDFNTQPYMSGLIIQLEYIKDGFWNGFEEYWQVNIIDQLPLKSPNNNAKSLGSFFEAKYPQIETGFFIYGDASGNYNTGISTSSSSIKTKTLFDDLLQGLSKSAKLNVQKRIPNKNPSYRSIGQGMLGRRVFINDLFNGNMPVRILINPNCTELLSDLEECTQDMNGKLAKPKNKEGFEPRGHFLQALEYFLCHPKAIGYLAKIKK
jgi:hypothetical protein